MDESKTLGKQLDVIESRRIYLLVEGGIAGILGGVCLFLIFSGDLLSFGDDFWGVVLRRLFFGAIALILFFWFGYCLARMWRSKILVFEEGIVIHNIRKTQTVFYRNIAGFGWRREKYLSSGFVHFGKMDLLTIRMRYDLPDGLPVMLDSRTYSLLKEKMRIIADNAGIPWDAA